MGLDTAKLKPQEGVLTVTNPYDNSVVATISDAGRDELQEAIERAFTSFASFSRTSPAARSDLLRQIAKGIRSRADEFAVTITKEVGKTIRESRYEVGRAIETFILASEAAKNITGETIPFDAALGAEDKVGFYMRVPAGVVGAITPFNFPLSLAAHKVAPAIAAGNTVVLKPSPKAPLAATELERVCRRVGLPDGVLSVVCSARDEIGELLVSDPRIRIVSFTGSYAVGEKIARKMGFKKFLAECGSNSALILAEDADLDRAMQRIPTGCFAVAGQVCISIQRIIVHDALYERLLRKLVEAARHLRAGDPLDSTADIGPMIDIESAERVERWVRQAVASGARILCGGARNENAYSPTVLVDVPADCGIWREEAFGPVVCVRRFSRLSEAIELVNDSDYGLQLGIYTDSVRTALAALREARTGAVLVNEIPTFRVDLMPYGGVGKSGIGREGIPYAVTEMSELKTICCGV